MLPSQEDMEKIFNASHHPSILTHEILTLPYTVLDQNGVKTSEILQELPKCNTHPVLIARYMLQLAIFLQRLHNDHHGAVKNMSESPRAITKRMVDGAISLVTTNEELIGSIEGLECVMIESMYQVNVGNLRRSWVANRRAMNIAQLMSLNRSADRSQCKVLDCKTECEPQLMWFRILFLDRQLCLMLGLPQGSLDHSIASPALLASDTPMGRLERIHCLVASRILARNESDLDSHNRPLTQALDLELRRAAACLPCRWYAPRGTKHICLNSKTNAAPYFTFPYTFQKYADLLPQLLGG